MLLDFDGTLAAIVDDPASARPVPGAVEVLATLAARFRTVGVVSGRPVAFLQPHIPDAVVLAGLYGLERRVAGAVTVASGADAWREPVQHAIALARAEGPAGLSIEDKGLSVTFHVRRSPELADQLDALAARLAEVTGLAVRPAKMSAELVPPLAIDKGVVVAELIAGARRAVFVGDDLGDLPAFEALAAAAADGVPVLRVAVDGPEAPPELLAAADLVLPGQDAVVPFLRALAAEASS